MVRLISALRSPVPIAAVLISVSTSKSSIRPSLALRKLTIETSNNVLFRFPSEADAKLARQCAAEGVDHVRYLVRLAELELIDRERRMVERRIRMAKFPAVKSLDRLRL
jgi:hypothetical protein